MGMATWLWRATVSVTSMGYTWNEELNGPFQDSGQTCVPLCPSPTCHPSRPPVPFYPGTYVHVCAHEFLVFRREGTVAERQDEPEYNFISVVLLSSCHGKSILLVTL